MSAAVRNRMGMVLVLVLWLFLWRPPRVVDCFESESNEGRFQWQILTERNFSSQILLHRHILLFVTLPWCGESRSLMKELSHQFSNHHHKLDSFKLMLVHSNSDKSIAEALGVSDGLPTVLFLYDAVAHKYQGSLRAPEIVSSANYFLSLVPEELPLRRLETLEDLNSFVASTDKAVILLESCGWTSKLLSQRNDCNTSSLAGSLFPMSFSEETNQCILPGREKKLKDFCTIEKGSDGLPWIQKFTFENYSARSLNTDDVSPAYESPCSFEEYRKFGVFFSKFMNTARNFFHPPQRQRYGFVHERTLFSSLGAENSGPWALVVHYAGCPNCSKVLKEEKHIQDALAVSYSPFMELESGDDLGPAFPSNTPSVVLFMDRSSSSAETRQTSKEALDALKEVALQYHKQFRMDEQNKQKPKKYSTQFSQVSRSNSGSRRFLMSPLSQRSKLKEKMSMMIINEGKPFTLESLTPNLQGSSVQEILSHLLNKKSQGKLSSIAKEAGFELISGDVDIKLAQTLSSQLDSQDTSASSHPSPENYSEKLYEVAQDQNSETSSSKLSSELLKLSDGGNDVELDREKASNLVTSQHSISVLNHWLNDKEVLHGKTLDSVIHYKVDPDQFVELSPSFQGATVSFFSADGNFKLLHSLTGQSKIPAMVIIDPVKQQHYIFPELKNVSFYSISDFINQFYSGDLVPYQRSSSAQALRDSPPPPFVNLDFHEKDYMPCLTSNTFSQLVLGSSHSDRLAASDAWKEDVMVLFSNRWCGFCLKMELVVREVYRFLKGYMKMIKSSGSQKLVHSYGDGGDKLPVIYQIDCTLNDCIGIFKSLGQRELYPSLLLFPAERKIAVPYEGDMVVGDIIKFLASHGSFSAHLMKQKGILWTETEKINKKEETFEEPPAAKGKYDVASFINREQQKQNRHYQLASEIPNGLREARHNIGVGSFLVATDKLSGLNLFNNATVLIVKADEVTGFQGLILNKGISWEAVPDMNEYDVLKEAPLSFGGPVTQPGMSLVALTKKHISDQYTEVGSGVYLLDQAATVQEILELKAGKRSAAEYWFFLGYSGWGWDQLFDEIDEGAWTVVDGNEQDLNWAEKWI